MIQKFRPLLSATAPDELTFPLLASPKLDGIRALVLNGQLVSRSLKPIPNHFTRNLFSRNDLSGMDGELVVGEPTHKHVFNTTSSGVMAHAGMPNVCFYVFDDFNHPNTPFYRRLRGLEMRVAAINGQVTKPPTLLKVVDHFHIKTMRALLDTEQYFVNEGYEGLMLRDPKGIYKYGRSTQREGILMKMKRFEDGEAFIIDAVPLSISTAEDRGKNELGYAKRSYRKADRQEQEMLGALVVEDCKTKQIFKIGSGFTPSQRAKYWKNLEHLMGEIVKYKHQPAGQKNKPRLPVFQGFRHEEDM